MCHACRGASGTASEACDGGRDRAEHGLGRPDDGDARPAPPDASTAVGAPAAAAHGDGNDSSHHTYQGSAGLLSIPNTEQAPAGEFREGNSDYEAAGGARDGDSGRDEPGLARPVDGGARAAPTAAPAAAGAPAPAAPDDGAIRRYLDEVREAACDVWPEGVDELEAHIDGLWRAEAAGDGLLPVDALPWAATAEPDGSDGNVASPELYGPVRGHRASVLVGYHGWDAVGAWLLTHTAPAFWTAAFDRWPVANEHVSARQGVLAQAADADDVYTEPERIPEADLAVSGSPCQGASWAPWCAGDGLPPTVDDPRNVLYAQQPKWIMARAHAGLLEFLSSVLRGEFLEHMHKPMLQAFADGGWTTVVWDLNAATRGADTPRKRAYTLAFSPAVVAAAKDAGVGLPELPPESAHVPRISNVLVDEGVVRAYHPHLFIDAAVPEPDPDTRRQLQLRVVPIGRVAAKAGWRDEAVWDADSPGLPLKVARAMPIVRLPSGALRRLLMCEFVALGGLPWAVGFGDCPRDAKTFAGNTWDAHITDLTMRATLEYMQPWLARRAAEQAPLRRIATFVAFVSARHSLPARRALRTWAAVTRTEAEWQHTLGDGAVLRLACKVDGETRHLDVRRHPMDAEIVQGRDIVDAAGAGDYEQALLPLPETRRPPRTLPRPPPEAPSAEECAKFAAQFRHWTQCLTPAALQRYLKWASDAFDDATHALDTSGAVNSGRRLRQRPGLAAAELRLGLEDFVEGARGKWIRVGDDGVPYLEAPLREAMLPHVAVRFDRLAMWMRRASWPDQELYAVAEWGASDGCEERQWLLSCSPNSAAAYKLYVPVCEAYDVEVGRGWIQRRAPCAVLTRPGGADGAYGLREPTPGEIADDCAVEDGHGGAAGDKAAVMRRRVGDPTPPMLPMTVTPTNAREKKNGTARLFANTSWPMPGTAHDEWQGEPVAPNAMKRHGALPQLEWASTEAMAHGAGVIAAVATEAGEQAQGACDDLWKWFRQVPTTTAAQRQQVLCWAKRFMADRMVQMGRFAAAHCAQRVSFLFGDIFFTHVVHLAWRWLRSVRQMPRWAALYAVVRRRMARFGLRGSGLLHLEICQDDLGWVAPCEYIAWIAWWVFPRVAAALGVRWSEEKRAEQGAPSARFTFMGVQFDLRCSLMRATADKQAAWARLMDGWADVTAGQLVPEKKLAATLGLGVFMCKSLRRGRKHLGRGFGCMAARRGDMKPVSHGLLTDLAALSATVRENRGVPLLVDPRWYHAGELGMAADASVSDDDGGYGGNVQQYAFSGVWAAAARRWCDISTLELYTVAFMVVVAGRHAGLTGRRLIMRSDNMPTVMTINKRGSSKPTMGAAYSAVDAACEAYCIDVLMVHVPGRRNVIADAYSRGRHDEADGLLRRLTGAEPVHCEIPAEWAEGAPMRALIAAAKRWRPKGVRHGTA